ncbi:MAG: phosphomannomutase/phosphoglucomutase [Thermodesulfobacteriota bacterium]
MTVLDPVIFREYDIRGIVGEVLNEEIAEIIGKAYGTLTKEKGVRRVSVGRDCRESSPALTNALIKGLNSTGLDVLDIGLVTTPLVYFSLFNTDVDGGIMVTASHNPGEYNGFKLCIGKDSLFGEGIQRLRKVAESGNFASGNGKVEKTDLLETYFSYLKDNIDIKPGLKVVIDGGNGTGGLTAPEILRRFGCEIIELYTELDGTFPNHHPDPTVEKNLVDMIKTVKENGYDVGLALDGDADRIGVVDEKGQIIWGDMLVLIYALDVLKNKKGATVIGDVKCSSNLFNGIANAGGNPIMWKTGHSLIKSKIKTENAALAGEMSGHIFFNDKFFGYDDAVYAGLRLLEILSKTGKKVSELLSGIPKTFSTPEIRVDCPDEIKFKVTEIVKNKLSDGNKVVDIDGVRVEYPDGWGLLRASNTQPALVLRFEAQSEKRLLEIRETVENTLEEAKRDAV